MWRVKGDTDQGSVKDMDTKPDPADATDMIQWVDTMLMSIDCMTKKVKCTELVKMLTECKWNFEQTPEALFRKRRQQELRQKAREKKNASKDGDDEVGSAALPEMEESAWE